MGKRVPAKYKRDPVHGRAMSWGSLYDRHFPENTDGASRHTRLIASDLLRDVHSPVRRLLIDAGHEPDHWAASLEVTVKDLWETREKLKKVCPHEEWETVFGGRLEKCSFCGQTRDVKQDEDSQSATR